MLKRFSLALILVLFSVLVLAFLNYSPSSEFVEVNNIQVLGNTIIVGRDCDAIVAETSPERAESIQLGLTGEIVERPNTHDIYAATLKTFNITLQAVEIYKIDENHYFSDMVFTKDNKMLRLDSKPSDAIAIALRTNSKIFVNRTLLAEVGQNVCG